MTGTAVVLGGRSSPHSTYIQVAGDGQHISACALRTAMTTSKFPTQSLRSAKLPACHNTPILGIGFDC
jgi:hypothetical protein